MSTRSLRTFALICSCFVAVGCSSAPLGVESVAGRYELRTVNGRSVPTDGLGATLSGELVLSRDGQARRVVRYATSGIPGPIDIRASGQFRVKGPEIAFELNEELRPSGTRRWRVLGAVEPSAIVLRYLGRGDRLVEERYVRAP